MSNVYPPIVGIPSATDFGLDPTLNTRDNQEPTYPRNARFGLQPENDSLFPASFFYSLGTHYILWEQSLADTKSLTDEGGTLLYPLIQVDLGGRRLQILLYVPALHDSSLNPR